MAKVRYEKLAAILEMLLDERKTTLRIVCESIGIPYRATLNKLTDDGWVVGERLYHVRPSVYEKAIGGEPIDASGSIESVPEPVSNTVIEQYLDGHNDATGTEEVDGA